MKIVGQKEEIFGAFKTAGKVLTQAAGKTIPQEIKVECLEDGTIRLFATDLERSIRCVKKSDKISVEVPGTAAVPGPKTLSILGAVEEGDITLELAEDGNVLLITCQGSEFRVNVSPVEEFPPFPEPAWDDPIQVEGAAFQSMIERTAFATAHEKIHFSLHGVFLRLEKKTLRMVGTDGRRLAIANGKVDRNGNDLVEVIVPTKGIKVFEELAGEAETVTLSLERNQLFLRAGEVEAGTLLIDGKYPEYEKAVPQDNKAVLDVDKEVFFSGLRKASVFADADSKGVWFKLEPGKLTLTSTSAGSGEAQVELDVAYEGDAFEIQFNPDFLRHVRKLVEGERMSIYLKDHKTAALLHKSDAFTYVVMPIVKK